MNVGIPGRPCMAGTVWLRMNLRRDGLEHDHYSVALHDAKKIFAFSISSTAVADRKAQLRAIKVQARLEIVHDKRRRNGV